MRRASRLGLGLAALLFCVVAPGARAQSSPAPVHLSLTLNAPRSARVAGYYAALALGYYAAAGLDVTLRPAANASEAPLAMPPRHDGIEIWSATLPQALTTPGLHLVNFAQILPHSGLELVCRKASAIHAPIDFAGHDIGLWRDAAAPLLAWLARLKLAAPGAVRLHYLPHAEGPEAAAPLLDRDVACLEAQSFDQYFDIVDAGLSPDELQVFHFADAGTATLGDGLYATAASLADPATASTLTRFLHASLQGWRFAIAHQPEAVGLLLHNRPPDAAARARALRAMAAIAPLTASGLQKPGYLEPAAYDRTVQILGLPPTPGGWTHTIWAAVR